MVKNKNNEKNEGVAKLMRLPSKLSPVGVYQPGRCAVDGVCTARMKHGKATIIYTPKAVNLKMRPL